MGALPGFSSEMTVPGTCGWVGAGLGQAQPACSPGALEQNVAALLCKYVRLRCLSDDLFPNISDHT